MNLQRNEQMPRTKSDRQAETIRDPCRQFRQILKGKQYCRKEERNLFNNKDIANWLKCSEANVSAKMNGQRDFSVRDIRMIMEHIEFTKDEKAAVFS
jgi:hypothetical protein